jgi:hypothetical protein
MKEFGAYIWHTNKINAKEKYGIKSDGSLTVALKNPNRTAAKLHWINL